MKAFTVVADGYAQDVTTGRIQAGRWVKLACEAHLKRRADPKSRWRWDEDEADAICLFAEAMPHVKGTWDTELLVLEPWQVFFLASIFAWRDVDGRRKHREAVLIVPRKNGKTALAVVIGLYMLTQDQGAPEVFCGATSEDQANEVFIPAKRMVEHPVCEGFALHYTLEAMAKQIRCHRNNGTFKRLVYRGTKEGSSPSCAIVDEYHQHNNDQMYQAQRTGQGARRDPLMLIISTTGDSTTSPLYAKEQECQRVLTGDARDERLFALIYAADGKDSWQDWEQWRQANPNLGVSVQEDFLRAQFDKAHSSAAERNTLLSRHLCIWPGGRSQWLDAVHLERAQGRPDGRPLVLEDFRGEPAIVSFDLATRQDLAARIVMFEESEGGDPIYYVFHTSYCPDVKLTDPKLSHYREWEDAGWLIATPGDETDLGQVEAEFREFAEDHEIVEVVYDQVNIAVGMYQRLGEEGFPIVKFVKTQLATTPAMSEIEGALAAGRLRIQADPCFLWQLGNVKLRMHRELKFPLKDTDAEKIDAPDALIAAIARSMSRRQDGPQVRELGADLFEPIDAEM